jgi:branched-chain amino acid transport system permease protein
LIEILGEGLRSLLESFGIDVPGIKQVVFGVILLVVVVAMPDGVWPWLARRLGLAEGQK